MRPASLVACAIALAGIVVVFWTDLTNLSLDNHALRGILFAALAALCFSCGNVVSDRAQSAGMPIVQTETFGMVYGAAFLVPVVLLTSGFQFSLDPRFVLSLGYLVIFGSIVAFGSYLTIIGRIGADRAGYITVLFPIVALLLSTFLESYDWTVRAGVGAALVLAGCALSVRLPAGPARRTGEPDDPVQPSGGASLTGPDSHRRPGAQRR
jgi:drug/metabolite transporter (DMT)-like permease